MSLYTGSGSAQSQVSNDNQAVAAGDSVPVGITTSVIVGVVGTAVNVLLLVGLGFYCLRRRNQAGKDLDDFIAEEEARAKARPPVPAAAPVPTSQRRSLDGVENPSFDVYATPYKP